MNGAIDPIERCEQLTAENAALRAACNKREEELLCVCEKNEKITREYRRMEDENLCLQRENIVLKAQVDMVKLIFSGYRG